MIARIPQDRLLRWSAYAAIPVLWFAIALFNPILLLAPPLTMGILWTLMHYGVVARHDPVEIEDPDFF